MQDIFITLLIRVYKCLTFISIVLQITNVQNSFIYMLFLRSSFFYSDQPSHRCS
ncbi:unnamed protein product [Rhodiola kirilowii]